MSGKQLKCRAVWPTHDEWTDEAIASLVGQEFVIRSVDDQRSTSIIERAERAEGGVQVTFTVDGTTAELIERDRTWHVPE